MNQTESVFIDFKRKEFPNTARDQYHRLYEALERKDKVELMKIVSVPLYDLMKICLKEKRELPFKIYEDVLDIKLVQGKGKY